MKALVREKQKAIALRKKGYSYSEILKEVPVAKSSLSLWLKDLPLTKSEKEVLRKRKNSNISSGRIKAASELRKRRLEREKMWLNEAEVVFSQLRNDPMFHIGVSLYWAEGSKRSNQWQFSNSDPEMIEIMLQWLEKFFSYHRTKLAYRIYAHDAYADQNIEKWWRECLELGVAKFGKTTRKPTVLGYSKRPGYKGCFRIEVPKSRHLLCKMRFWQKMTVAHFVKQ